MQRENCFAASRKKKKKEKSHELTWESGIRTACFKLNRKMFSHHPHGPDNSNQEGLSGQCADMSYNTSPGLFLHVAFTAVMSQRAERWVPGKAKYRVENRSRKRQECVGMRAAVSSCQLGGWSSF